MHLLLITIELSHFPGVNIKSSYQQIEQTKNNGYILSLHVYVIN